MKQDIFLFTLLSMLGLPATALAQTAPPNGPTARFSRAEVEVGQPLDYELSYVHDPAEEVVFPDSLAAFGPFEYAGRRALPTRTEAGRSLDRVIYHLRTFSLAPTQSLQLPVLVLRGPADTLRRLPSVAQVRLRRLSAVGIGAAGGLPALRPGISWQPLAPAFNYPFWLAGLAGGLALVGAAWALYGRRWRQRYGGYKRRKNHVYFLAQFARHTERFALSRSAPIVERAVVLWKNYLSSLEGADLNLSSLTTRELVAHFRDAPAVDRALRTTDRIVYGNLLSEDPQEIQQVEAAFQLLRDFAEAQFEQAVGS